MMNLLGNKSWKGTMCLLLAASMLASNLYIYAMPRTQGDVESRIAEAVALYHNKQISQAVTKFREIGEPAVPAVMELLKTAISSGGMPMLILTGFFSATTGQQVDMALIELLSSESPYVRGFAAISLGQRKLRIAVPQLIKLLEDKGIYLTRNTISHLYTRGNKDAEVVVEENHILVRDKAVEALESITGLRLAKKKSGETKAKAWLGWWQRQKMWK